MTVWLVDKSDFDTDRSMPAGFSGGTYKFTEGTTTVHTGGPSTLNAWRVNGAPILGAYHVLRTPGNGGNGSLSSQLDFWLSHLDAGVPWWRDVPFMLQVDAEKWPYDSVSAERNFTHAEALGVLHPKYFTEVLAQRASTTVDFCTLLNNTVSHGWKICYASRGQYGDTLTGIPIDLWNAHYVGTYPGDASSDFAPYSGKRPAGLQYTSTPFDKNGFPGTVQDLLFKMGGTMTDPLTPVEQGELLNADRWSYALATLQRTVQTAWGDNPAVMRDTPVPAAAVLDDLRQVLAGKPDDPTKPIPLLTLLASLQTGGVTQDMVNSAVAAAVNDPAWIAKMAEANAAAFVTHVH